MPAPIPALLYPVPGWHQLQAEQAGLASTPLYMPHQSGTLGMLVI